MERAVTINDIIQERVAWLASKFHIFYRIIHGDLSSSPLQPSLSCAPAPFLLLQEFAVHCCAIFRPNQGWHIHQLIAICTKYASKTMSSSGVLSRNCLDWNRFNVVFSQFCTIIITFSTENKRASTWFIPTSGREKYRWFGESAMLEKCGLPARDSLTIHDNKSSPEFCHMQHRQYRTREQWTRDREITRSVDVRYNICVRMMSAKIGF